MSHWTDTTDHRGQALRIADLSEGVHVLTGHTFEDCVIHGPAVLMFFGEETRWDTPNFVVSSEAALFYELPAGKLVKPDGAIGINGCVFRRCRFERISLFASADAIRQMRAALMPRRDLPH